MTQAQQKHMLAVPDGPVDAVLDSDAYNEVDDQFAIAYLLRSEEKVRLKAIYAAPFYSQPFFDTPIIAWRSESPGDGMEKSYAEIKKVVALAGREEFLGSVLRGATDFLPDETRPIRSAAAEDLAARAMQYTPEHPLYVVSIGAMTNIASALLLQPGIRERIVVSALSGDSHQVRRIDDFNLIQDIAAARIVYGCGVPLVQLPCGGVVSAFTTSIPELRYWLCGKNALCDYLLDITTRDINWFSKGGVGSHAIWDVTAAAWLLNDDDRFMQSTLVPAPLPEYDRSYSFDERRHLIRYVYQIRRDALYADLFEKLAQGR